MGGPGSPLRRSHDSSASFVSTSSQQHQPYMVSSGELPDWLLLDPLSA